MSRDDRSAEDVAGLFRKFGGDSHVYKEFSPPEEAQEATAWPLLSGAPVERAPAAAPAPFVAPPPAAPPVAAPQPVFSARPPEIAPATPTPAAFAPAAARPNELQALFARLAESQDRAAPSGPMSRWRRPT